MCFAIVFYFIDWSPITFTLVPYNFTFANCSKNEIGNVTSLDAFVIILLDPGKWKIYILV